MDSLTLDWPLVGFSSCPHLNPYLWGYQFQKGCIPRIPCLAEVWRPGQGCVPLSPWKVFRQHLAFGLTPQLSVVSPLSLVPQTWIPSAFISLERKPSVSWWEVEEWTTSMWGEKGAEDPSSLYSSLSWVPWASPYSQGTWMPRSCPLLGHFLAFCPGWAS